MNRIKLDKYEQSIEKDYDQFVSAPNIDRLKKQLKAAAKRHVQNKKIISIRIAQHDLEAIKVKASKLGIPYQTYINMVLHKEVTNQKPLL